MATLFNKLSNLLQTLIASFTGDNDSAWDSYRKSKVLATQPIRKDY